MDESLFDEFGNYIGPELPSGNNGASTNYMVGDTFEATSEYGGVTEADQGSLTRRQEIVLHEDKKYYLSAEEVYGPEVETLVQDEDTQPLTEPIIAPIKVKRFQHEEPTPLLTTFESKYMLGLMDSVDRVRNIAVVGHIHHGKTSLVDLLVTSTHPTIRVPEGRLPLYMDRLFLEQDRCITIKAKPISLLLPTSQGTSMVLNVMDTPGHTDFADEVAAALRMADGIVLVVDAAEGVLCQTEELLQSALLAGLPLIIIINKVERLFLELKLPPTDAFYKLRHIIEEINTILTNLGGQETDLVSPEKGNVLFSSTLAGWIFSLESFAAIFVKRTLAGESKIDSKAFAKRLWGDIYYNSERGTFHKAPAEEATKRTFVSFILEPLYKMYTSVLSDEKDELKRTLSQLNIRLKEAEYNLNTKTVLRLVCNYFFNNSIPAFVDAVVGKIMNPQEAAFDRIVRSFSGALDCDMCKAAQKCNSSGPLVAFASKVYPIGDGTKFEVLVRVFSGTLKQGQTVKLLSETDDLSESDNQIAAIQVTGLKIGCGRYSLPTSTVPAGCWALVMGIDEAISKTATLIDATLPFSTPGIFKCLTVRNRALLKVAVEPVTPSELPKMLDGLRKISKTYPLLSTRVEDSGEHTVLGTGELYLDCALYDLRRLYTDIEVRVADPVAKFSETVVESSYIKCFAETPNKRNKLTIICEPLEASLTEALEAGKLPSPQSGPEAAQELSRILRTEYGWDILAARSVWAFGPDELLGPNILLNDTLPSEVDQVELNAVRDQVAQGFQWACREGPLCEEPVRGVKFRLIDATLANLAIHRGGGQIIPTARRACYVAMLTAAPRLLEPLSFVEVQTQGEFVEAVYAVLAKRRGHVTQDIPRAGTPLYTIRALLPLLDSAGFETDLRIHTHGMAFCQMRYSHWAVVPGDPLDRTLRPIPLEPSPAPLLARDCLLKTRRRKGLGEDVAITKFFDESMLAELAREETTSDLQGLQL